MKNISLHIEYLLTCHDCVVVPGWGALVVQHTPAVIDADNGILPPRRWISFNSQLTHNDGLLAHSLMQERHCSYDAAMVLINDEVHRWRKQLSCGDVVQWDNIGSFSSQEQGTTLFVEDTQAVVNVPNVLYEPLSIPLLADVLPLYDEEETGADVLSSGEPISWHRRAWQAVATVAAAVIVMLFIATPIDTYTPSNEYASLVVNELLSATTITAEVNNEEMPLAQEPILSSESVEHGATAPVEEEVEAIMPAVEPDEPEGDEIQEVPVPRYILVIGSLPSQRLAEKQIAEFAAMGVDDEISIYECDGKYRLYAEGYATLAEAQQRVSEMATQTMYPGVWICATRR